MQISSLISVLEAIKASEGDILVKLAFDPRQNTTGVDKTNDILRLVKLNKGSVVLSNEFRTTAVYNRIRGEMWYNADKKSYEGSIVTNIPGFSGKFVGRDLLELENNFKKCVDEYLDFIANAQVLKTKEIVNNINRSNENIEEEDIDLDYGDIDSPDYQEEDDEDEDDDYGEI